MLRLRLVLDTASAGLLLLGLAYYWLDNRSHELIGTGMFLLIFGHNVLNRRWYGTVPKTRREPRALLNVALTAALLAAMLALLVTSLMISRTAFGFVGFDGGFTTRQIHKLAAYWALVAVSIHLGLRWSMLMGIVRGTFRNGKVSTCNVVSLRLITVALAAYGVQSSFDMGIGSKLTMRITMDMWDFEQSTVGFFARHLSIAALYICIAHYASTWLQHWARSMATAARHGN